MQSGLIGIKDVRIRMVQPDGLCQCLAEALPCGTGPPLTRDRPLNFTASWRPRSLPAPGFQGNCASRSPLD